MITKSKTKNQMLECLHCHKKFRGEQGLKTHIGWVHDKAGKAKRMAAAIKVGAARSRLAKASRNERMKASSNGSVIPVKVPLITSTRVRAELIEVKEIVYCPRCALFLPPVKAGMNFRG